MTFAVGQKTEEQVGQGQTDLQGDGETTGLRIRADSRSRPYRRPEILQPFRSAKR